MDDITIITCIFKLEKNKYDSNYYEWMSNLLLNADKYMVIYVSRDYYEIVKELRKNYEDKTRIIITKLENFYVYKYLDYFKKDLERDHEKPHHNTDLYMIWNEKLKMVENAMKLNPFGTNYYCWCDIGYVRNKHYIQMYMKNFPNLTKIKEDPTKVYYLNIDYQITAEDFKDPYNEKYRYEPAIIGGGFVIGRKKEMEVYINKYYEMLETYISKDKFIGKDQTLIMSVYLENPNMIKLIRGENDHFNTPFCQLKWFYFLKYLS